ncbi:glucokinase [Rhodobacteraceae bacterium RKSG542]|uniref:glucokinase n=1 Tax=Pseudovibrio flavus TaxID=2529854 RepID=UPI0012BD3FCD|nr:glucokinase [Pseudovibrio flavus]MTI17219.1 glucokinase [Pseudovibrio flavus]
MPSSLQFPVVIADIGGTNARFALVETPDSESLSLGQVPTADHESLQDAAKACLSNWDGAAPRSAVVAVAGPVTGDIIPLTNAHWVIEPRSVIAALALDSVVVLNDFEAQALALPSLDGAHLEQLGPKLPAKDASKFVLGPGTGLGAAAMVHACGKWVPTPGEGGHVELGPVSEEEYRIWPFIEKEGGRIGAEQILCGSGLVRLASAVAAQAGASRSYEDPADVPKAASSGDEIAEKAMQLFCAALGRVAGDFALTILARGGVYLAGGIPPKIAPWLRGGAFRQAFEAKAPHNAIMAEIPTFIVTHDNPALEGLAAYARNSEGYLVDTTGRRWVK